MAAAIPELPWTVDEVKADAVGKKDIISWLQEHASFAVRHVLLPLFTLFSSTWNIEVLVSNSHDRW